jgi:phosphoglycolate phosphatase
VVIPVDVVILDVDGTVATCPIDFRAMREAVAVIANRRGFDLGQLRARGVIEQIEQAAGLHENGQEFREEATQAVVAIELEAAREANLLPGAAQALSQLRKRGLAVALITRNCRAASEIVLRELREYDLLLTRDDVPRPKPDPDHVHRCLAVLGRRPANAAMVGDHDFDMQAGRAAGVQVCIGVRTGSSADSSLLKAGADVVLDSLADLPDWLQKRQAAEMRGDVGPTGCEP